MKKNNYIQSLKILEELNKEHPTFGIGRHISTALSDYGDLWGISDKEFLFALEKYKSILSMDSDNHISEEYVAQLEEEARHMFDESPYKEEED